jgi:hypothetical protein
MPTQSPLLTVMIQGHTAEDYAAMWGCDNSYDTPPNEIGDGDLFDQFGSDSQPRDMAYLTRFKAAIGRTRQKVEGHPGFQADDVAGLDALAVHVQRLINCKGPADQNRDEVVDWYLKAAIWSSVDDDQADLDATYNVSDFSYEAVAKAYRRCQTFMTLAKDLLAVAPLDASDVGYNLWMTQGHHGVGFWDRGLGEVGQQLTTFAQQERELHVVIGDDGELHLE